MMGVGIAVPKKGYWSQPDVLKKHAKTRRDKYATNPDHAREEKARQRRIYRERIGADFKNPARDALEGFDEAREYTASSLSKLMGRAPEYINRLIGRGLWPDPRPEGATMQQPCFDGPIAKRLVEAFANHVDDVSNHYRADHTETTKALFAAMNKEG